MSTCRNVLLHFGVPFLSIPQSWNPGLARIGTNIEVQYGTLLVNPSSAFVKAREAPHSPMSRMAKVQVAAALSRVYPLAGASQTTFPAPTGLYWTVLR